MPIPGFSLARRLRNGETVHTGWCGLPYPIVAEVVAREGFAAVTLDAQHGLWDMAAIPAGIAQIRQAGAAALLRIPVRDYAAASRALDWGAEGIVAPMINTKPWMTGTSPLSTPSNDQPPTPGQEKTLSTIAAPLSAAANNSTM